MVRVKRWCFFYQGTASYYFTLDQLLDALMLYSIKPEDCDWYICGGETIIVDGEQ